jgi:5-methylcytosine-specific restriction endonuclease McrA
MGDTMKEERGSLVDRIRARRPAPMPGAHGWGFRGIDEEALVDGWEERPEDMRTNVAERAKIEANQRDVPALLETAGDVAPRIGGTTMHADDTAKSPRSFSFSTNTHMARLDSYPWAPALARVKSNGTTEWHAYRCPYCAHSHKFVFDSMRRLPTSWSYDAPCGFDVFEGRLIARMMPVDRAPSDEELDEFFPLVEYGVQPDYCVPRTCFRFERNDRGFIQIVNELHEDWLPGNVLHERYVRGNTILPHTLTSVASIRQPIPRELRAAVWDKTLGHCYLCGVPTNPFENLHIDHCQSVHNGGTNDLENLWPACADCNLSKGAMSLETYRERRGGGLFWFEIARNGGAS